MVRRREQVGDERRARMVLSMIAEPDDAVTGKVLRRTGGVETLRLLHDRGLAVPGMNRADAIAWRERMTGRVGPDVSRRLAEAEADGFGVLIPSDAHWPAGVNDLGDRAPYVLWTRGATSFLAGDLRGRVAVTGSRASSSYGMTVTGEITGELANKDRVIVAGGAYGIEGAAHRAALATGSGTVAVLANGVNRAYPSGHAELLERIGDLGLLVSELPPGAAPTKWRFLARARLVAAVSGAVLVPEASSRSMSLRTAAEAGRLGRAVGAVPGPVTSAASTGANALLKRGAADVVTHAGDVTDLLDTASGRGSRERAVAFEQRREPAGAGQTRPAPAL